MRDWHWSSRGCGTLCSKPSSNHGMKPGGLWIVSRFALLRSGEFKEINHQLLLVGEPLWAGHDDMPVNGELRPSLRPADTVLKSHQPYCDHAGRTKNR